MDKIGERLKNCRLAAGYTQEEVAKLLGFKSRSYICECEKNRCDKLTVPTLSRFADLYGVTVSYLLGWDKKEESYQLSKDEEILLEAYRKNDGTYRKMMEMIIFNYLEDKKKEESNAESKEN